MSYKPAPGRAQKMKSPRHDLLRHRQLQLQSLAAHFDLYGAQGRARSAAVLRKLFFGLVKDIQPRVFVEAGANDGQTSVDIRQMFATMPELTGPSRVVAFEANPYNFKHYGDKRDFASQGVEYLNLAVTNVPGPVTFQVRTSVGGSVTGPLTGRNSLLKRANEEATYEEVTVDGTTLDVFFANEGGPFALWIDVEGASRQVLTGAESVLARADVVLIEVEDAAVWEGQWLTDEVAVYLDSLGLIAVARDFEYRSQHNELFVRDERLSECEIKRNFDYYYGKLLRES